MLVRYNSWLPSGYRLLIARIWSEFMLLDVVLSLSLTDLRPYYCPHNLPHYVVTSEALSHIRRSFGLVVVCLLTCWEQSPVLDFDSRTSWQW